MGDGTIAPRLGNMKALLGIVAGAGASYGIYKLISGGGLKRNKRSATSESKSSPQCEIKLQPGTLLARVSGLDVVCPRSVDVASGKDKALKAGLSHASYPPVLCSDKTITTNTISKSNCWCCGP